MRPSLNAFFWPAWSCLAILSLALLWSLKYPPQVDLPQHAAQITLWELVEEADHDYAEVYEWNGFAPYASCYFLGRMLAWLLPIRIAMKLLVTLAVLALPVAMLFVLHRFQGDRWWCLPGFALAFSFNFYWGLLNFMIAVPLGICLVVLAFDYARRRSWALGLAVALLGSVLFFTHGLVCGFTLLAAGAVILAVSPNFRSAVFGQVPLLFPAALGIVWFVATRLAEPQASQPPAWNPDWQRLLELPGMLLGSAADVEAQLFGGLLLLILLTGMRASNDTEPLALRQRVARVLPVVQALVFFLLGPSIFFHAAFFNSRFAIFVIPFALFALGSLPAGSGKPLLGENPRRILLAVLTAAWLFNLHPRFAHFDREARRFEPLMDVMEPHKRLLGIVFEPFSETLDTPSFLHHFAWYQAEKGGHVDFSFAYFYVQPIRYRKDHEPRVPDYFSWRPETLDWEVHGGYDYYVVRSAEDPRAFFNAKGADVAFRLRSGDWWLYELSRSRPRGRE